MMGEVLAVAFEGYPIRVTDKTPKEAALIDVLGAMGYAHPKDALHDLREKYPELVGSRGQ